MTVTQVETLLDHSAPAHVAVALLGLRFLDYATGQPVIGGLMATAVPADQATVAVRAVMGPSGIASFHDVPGMSDVEFLAANADASIVPSPPHTRAFHVLIEDDDERFLPAVFTVDLPLPSAGGEPPLLDVPLFASPTRPITPGLAAIRADLQDALTGAPVPNALVRVDVGGVAGMGLADGRGRALVLVATPIADRLRLGSPPGTGQSGLGAQTWSVTVTVFAFAAITPAGRQLPPPWGGLPSLKTLLSDQPQVPIEIVPGTSAPSWTGTLTNGEELVLRTGGSSFLAVIRGGSPP
jgi:hypothetical protein